MFNIELKIEMCKNVLLHLNFKLKIEWHFRIHLTLVKLTGIRVNPVT